MALSNIEESITRSIYEAIRLVLVEEGYTPDITALAQDGDGDVTSVAMEDYNAEIENIKADKGFAVETFSDSSQFEKGEKNIPRITINPLRIIPGDIGALGTQMGYVETENPDLLNRRVTDWNTSHMQYDIILTTRTAKQRRVLNAVIFKALGTRKHIPLYTDATQYIFIHQYNYYNLLEDDKGIKENIYSYEVRDIFMFDDIDPTTTIAKIKEITVETTALESSATANNSAVITGPHVEGEKLIIDLSNVTFE